MKAVEALSSFPNSEVYALKAQPGAHQVKLA